MAAARMVAAKRRPSGAAAQLVTESSQVRVSAAGSYPAASAASRTTCSAPQLAIAQRSSFASSFNSRTATSSGRGSSVTNPNGRHCRQQPRGRRQSSATPRERLRGLDELDQSPIQRRLPPGSVPQHGPMATCSCAFTHPSAQGALRWADTLTAPSLTGTVCRICDRRRRLSVA